VRLGLPLSLRLALADLRHEWRLSLCTALAIAAVLAPLLILAGLRAGVIGGLRETLLENPSAREVTTATNRTFTPEDIAALRARPEVAFVVPRVRALAAAAEFRREGMPGSPFRGELLSTAPGDPLLPGVPPLAPDGIVLSASAAARLGAAQPGDAIVLRLLRQRDGRFENLTLPLTVTGIAPPSAFDREGGFVPLALTEFVEEWQELRAEGPWDPAAPQVARRSHAGFRAYARRLEDVPELAAALRAEGVEIRSRAGEIAQLLSLDRNLALLLLIVAGVGGAGYVLSLGAGLWAGVERKRERLALLRLFGLSRAGLLAFPLVQAALLAATGAVLGAAGAVAAAAGINRAFAGMALVDRPLCVVLPLDLGIAAAATLAGAMAAALLAARRAARAEPFEGLRGG
jgi:putative ABC transport system permease protein